MQNIRLSRNEVVYFIELLESRRLQIKFELQPTVSQGEYDDEYEQVKRLMSYLENCKGNMPIKKEKKRGK